MHGCAVLIFLLAYLLDSHNEDPTNIIIITINCPDYYFHAKKSFLALFQSACQTLHFSIRSVCFVLIQKLGNGLKQSYTWNNQNPWMRLLKQHGRYLNNSFCVLWVYLTRVEMRSCTLGKIYLLSFLMWPHFIIAMPENTDSQLGTSLTQSEWYSHVGLLPLPAMPSIHRWYPVEPCYLFFLSLILWMITPSHHFLRYLFCSVDWPHQIPSFPLSQFKKKDACIWMEWFACWIVVVRAGKYRGFGKMSVGEIRWQLWFIWKIIWWRRGIALET